MSSPKTSQKDLSSILHAAGPGGKPRRRAWLIAGAVLVTAAAAYAALRRPDPSKGAPAFATTALAKGDVTLTITSTGNLKPTNEVTIGSELSGTVMEVLVEANDRVTKGQPLAILDTTKLSQQTLSSKASLKAAQAKQAQCEATLREADANLERLRELNRLSGGRSPSKLDMDSAEASDSRARADLLSAQANVEQLEAQVKANETDLAKGVIRSPIDGIVLTRSVEPGQTVAASFTAPELFVIAENLSNMKLTISVAEADIGRLAAGQKARFTVDAWPGRTYTANVVRVSYGSSVTNNVVTYETELEVRNDDLSLRPGMTATADVTVARSSGVFRVPATALRFDPASSMPQGGAAQNKTFLQSLMPMPPRMPSGKAPGGEAGPADAQGARIWLLRDGMPVPVPVKVGLSDGRNTEISGENLQEGQPVITRSQAPAS